MHIVSCWVPLLMVTIWMLLIMQRSCCLFLHLQGWLGVHIWSRRGWPAWSQLHPEWTNTSCSGWAVGSKSFAGCLWKVGMYLNKMPSEVRVLGESLNNSRDESHQYVQIPVCSALSVIFLIRPPFCHEPCEIRTLSQCQAGGEGCKNHQESLTLVLPRNEGCTWFQRTEDCQKAKSEKSSSSHLLQKTGWNLRKNQAIVKMIQFHSAFLELGQKKSPVEFPGFWIRLSSVEFALGKKMEGS